MGLVDLMPANNLVKSYRIKLFTWKSESCSWCLVVERRESLYWSMVELNLSSTQSSSGSVSPLEISTLPVLANIREDKKKRHTWMLPRWGSRKKNIFNFYELKSKTSSLFNPPTMSVNGLKTPSPPSAFRSGSSLRILEPGKGTIKTKPICLRHFAHHIHECRSFSFAPPPPV